VQDNPENKTPKGNPPDFAYVSVKEDTIMKEEEEDGIFPSRENWTCEMSQMIWTAFLSSNSRA
jgi:hypothetical protein